MAKKTRGDYAYKLYRIAWPQDMHVTTVSYDRLEDLTLARKARRPDALRAIVRVEAARVRASADYKGTLSAAVLRLVKAVLF